MRVVASGQTYVLTPAVVGAAVGAAVEKMLREHDVIGICTRKVSYSHSDRWILTRQLPNSSIATLRPLLPFVHRSRRTKSCVAGDA
jgi:hypothetical protein